MSQILPFIQGAGALYGATQAFRGGGQPQQTTQVGVDPATQARYQDIYQRALGLSGQPFIPYTGPQIAGFSPDELRAFGAARTRFGQAQAFDPFAQRQQLMQAPVPSLLSTDIEAYRSPFEQGVVDVALGDIQRQADIAQQRAQEQAIRAGAFGGSRGAILEAEAARPYAEQVARVAPQLRQAGFEQAQRAAESDIERQLRQQQFQANLIGQQEQAQRAAVSGLLGTGAQQRAMQQQALGVGRREFERALQYPYQQFGLLSQAVSGIPGTQTTTQSSRLSTQGRIGQGLEAIERLGGYFPSFGGTGQQAGGGMAGGKGGMASGSGMAGGKG